MQTPLFHADHAVIRTGPGTALIAFKTGIFPDPRTVPRIHRYYRTKDGGLATDSGRAFGLELGSCGVLLVNTTPGCLIQIIEWRPEIGHMIGIYYRIGPEYEVEFIKSEGREISRFEIEIFLHASSFDEAGPREFQNCDLQPLFHNKLPPWLREIVDAQLNHWRVHNVGMFYRFTPWPVDQEDIWRCVKAAPYWALRRWKDRLTSYQLMRCIRMSPLGAVCFAVERLPVILRKNLLDKYTAEALFHAADKMTEAELIRCATKDPGVALSLGCRRRLPPALQATLLAAKYQKIVPWKMDEALLRDLQRDILESIGAFPAEWLAAHEGGFAGVYEGLASHLSVRPEGSMLIEMRDRMEPPYQKAFTAYIGSLI